MVRPTDRARAYARSPRTRGGAASKLRASTAVRRPRSTRPSGCPAATGSRFSTRRSIHPRACRRCHAAPRSRGRPGKGFSRPELIDADGRASTAVNGAALSLQMLQDGAALPDSVGLSFVARQLADQSTGALFFSRALFDRVGGFRDQRYDYHREFCPKAALNDEPVLVPEPLLRVRTHGANTIETPDGSADAEADEMLVRTTVVMPAMSTMPGTCSRCCRRSGAPVLAARDRGRPHVTASAPNGRAARGPPVGAHRRMTTPDWTTVLASVIVAMNPHDHDFAAVLDAWAAQSAAGDYEVIVAHDGCRASLPSEFATHKLKHPSTPVRLVGSVAAGRAASNNAGVRASRGDLLLFVADDFLADLGLVAVHRAFHEAIGRPAVGIGPGYFSGSTRADPFVRWLEDSVRNIWGASVRDRRRAGGRTSSTSATRQCRARSSTRSAASTRRSARPVRRPGVRRLFATGVTAAHFVLRAIARHDHELNALERAATCAGRMRRGVERELSERLRRGDCGLGFRPGSRGGGSRRRAAGRVPGRSRTGGDAARPPRAAFARTRPRRRADRRRGRRVDRPQALAALTITRTRTSSITTKIAAST